VAAYRVEYKVPEEGWQYVAQISGSTGDVSNYLRKQEDGLILGDYRYRVADDPDAAWTYLILTEDAVLTHPRSRPAG
jgi:hypothetical protein